VSNKDDSYERECYFQELSEMDRTQTEVDFLIDKIEGLELRLKECEQVLGMLESFENWDIKAKTSLNTYGCNKTGIYSRFKEYTDKYKK
jgi:hypothetical protein